MADLPDSKCKPRVLFFACAPKSPHADGISLLFHVRVKRIVIGPGRSQKHVIDSASRRIGGAGSRSQNTLPPRDTQSSRVATSLHPIPLQEFCPLQDEVAVLQALVPLQELTPRHFTLPPPAEAAGAIATANNAAADERRSRR
jgi:hypothetical protein